MYIENDSLLSSLKLSLEKLSKNTKFRLEKELVENRHVYNLIDTVKIFRFKETNIKFYKTVSEEWIFEAQILNSELQFSNFIKINMPKNALEEVLKMKLNSDIIKIGNLEQTSVFVFKFKDDNLEGIIYEGYLD